MKNGWALIKTNKQKPTGWKGYSFTVYETDDVTVMAELQAKTARGIFNKILKFVKKCEDKYPMTGKPDPEAAYKNGWYDCAYSIRKRIEEAK